MKKEKRIGDYKNGEKLFCSYVGLKGSNPFEVEILNTKSMFSEDKHVDMDVKKDALTTFSLLNVEIYKKHSIIYKHNNFCDIVIGTTRDEVLIGCIKYSLAKQHEWIEYEKKIISLLNNK